MSQPQHTPQQFKADVEAKLRESAPSGAQAAAFDASKLRKVIKAVEQVAEKFGPLISTLTPPQYRVFVDLAAKFVEELDQFANGSGAVEAAQ